MKKKRNPWVDVIRVFAMVWIVLFHFSVVYESFYPTDEPLPVRFNNGASVGNVLFFLISGFFAAKSSTKVSPNLQGVFSFCVNKIWRVYPAYLVAICMIFIVGCSNVGFNGFLINLLPIHSGFPYVDGAHWFLSTLLVGQFLLSAIILLRSEVLKNVYVLALMFVCFGLLFFSKLHGLELPFIMWLPALFIGYFAANLQQISEYKVITWGGVVLPTIYCAAFLNWQNIIWIPITLFVLSNRMPVHLFSTKLSGIIMHFGEVTFFWYLIHENIGFKIINNFTPYTNRLWATLIAMIATLLGAELLRILLQRVPIKIFKESK